MVYVPPPYRHFPFSHASPSAFVFLPRLKLWADIPGFDRIPSDPIPLMLNPSMWALKTNRSNMVQYFEILITIVASCLTLFMLSWFLLWFWSLIWQLTWNDMHLHHHTSQFQNLLLPHFSLVYTCYTTMFPSFYPAPHDLRPAKPPKMRFCVASIRRMLSSRRTCSHADGAMVGEKYGYFPSKP